MLKFLLPLLLIELDPVAIFGTSYSRKRLALSEGTLLFGKGIVLMCKYLLQNKIEHSDVIITFNFTKEAPERYVI
ncbi:hypothetical protein B7486_47300 [cyanobacterium TDX16]|nr:hypothetical protein B7486_47300 [cyanobacterium TDX16]